MNLAGHLADRFDASSLRGSLIAEGLDIPSLKTYSIQALTNGLLFGLTAFEMPDLLKGVEALSKAFEIQGR